MKVHTALIAAGACILIAALIVWFLTERQSVLMAMSGVFLVLTGALQAAQEPWNGGAER